MDVCGRVWLSLKRCLGLDRDGRREIMSTMNSMAVMPHYRPKVPLPPLLKDPNLFGLSHEQLLVEESVCIYTFARPAWQTHGAGIVRILTSMVEPKATRMVLVRGSVELVGCNHFLSNTTIKIQEAKNDLSVSWACSDRLHIKPEIVIIKFKDEVAAKYFKSKLMTCIAAERGSLCQQGEVREAVEVTRKSTVQLEAPKQVDVHLQHS